MSVAFEDIHVDRVKAALTDPAAVAAFESLMEQLDQARNVALVMGTALFEMRGELAAAWKCQTCEGEGAVPDGHGDFETCPDCGVDWRARADRAEAALTKARAALANGAHDDLGRMGRAFGILDAALSAGSGGPTDEELELDRAGAELGWDGVTTAAERESAGSGGRETTP